MDTPSKRRLPRAQREKQIIEEAIRFFAEHGLDGQTRALAERLGVTQPLLYRYFPDKEAIIQRVFQHLFIQAWDQEWDRELLDRSLPLAERLVRFYHHYAHMNFGYERMRLYMFAALKDQKFACNYQQQIRQRLFTPLAGEMLAAAGCPDLPPGEEHIETIAALHGAVSYASFRYYVVKCGQPADLDSTIGNTIRTLLQGALAHYAPRAG